MRSVREVYAQQALSAQAIEHWSGPPTMVDRIAGVMGTLRWHRILDVGCGLGGPARRLSGAVGCRVTGIDLVEEVVRAAAARPGPGVGYLVGEASRLPVADGTFDQVWCLGALAHLSTIEQFATECARVLVPGGSVAITEAFRAGHRAPLFGPGAPQPWRDVSVEETMMALKEAGLRRVRVLPWPGDESFPPSDPVLARDLADGRLVNRLVVARRP
jgi:ubiquinone/menaquinone biosynthesis C-methylase UbiE